MNPNLCRIVLRPRGPLEVFDLAWRFLGARLGVFTRLFVMVLLPVWLVALPIGWWTGWHWGVAIGVGLVGTALRLPFTLLAGRLMFADEVSLREVLSDALSRPSALFGLLGVHAAAWGVGIVSCGTSLIPTWGLLLWLPESLLLEQRRGGRRLGAYWAAQRSWHLASQGGVGALAGVAGTLFLTAWFAAMAEACGAAGTAFFLQIGSPFGSPLTLQATPWILLGLLAVQPVIAVFRLLLYVDTRTRTEGWDLQVALRAVGLA